MATTADTPGRDNSHGQTTEEQLEQLLTSFEAVDWAEVDGVTVAEAAALGAKLTNARLRAMEESNAR